MQNKTNSMNMTPDQIEETYPDKPSPAALMLVRKHIHWVERDLICRICGELVLDVDAA